MKVVFFCYGLHYVYVSNKDPRRKVHSYNNKAFRMKIPHTQTDKKDFYL